MRNGELTRRQTRWLMRVTVVVTLVLGWGAVGVLAGDGAAPVTQTINPAHEAPTEGTK